MGQVSGEQLKRAGVVQGHGGFNKAHEGGPLKYEVEGAFAVEDAFLGNGGAEFVFDAEVGEEDGGVDNGGGVEFAPQGTDLPGGGDHAPAAHDFCMEGVAVVDVDKADSVGELGGFVINVGNGDVHAGFAGVVDDASAHFAVANDEELPFGYVAVAKGGHGAQEAFTGAKDGFYAFDAPAIDVEDGEGGAFVAGNAGAGEFTGAQGGGDAVALPGAVKDDVKVLVLTLGAPNAEAGEQGFDFRRGGQEGTPRYVEFCSGGQQGHEFAQCVAVEWCGIQNAQTFQRAAVCPFLRLLQQAGPLLCRIKLQQVFFYVFHMLWWKCAGMMG